MSDIVIRVDELGKQYKIGAQLESYRTLRETLVHAAGAPIRRLIGAFKGRTPGQSERMIWALKDVSFEVKQGDVVGFIGPNGAGKTTLLKVLSRITKPTEGTVDLWGRVGSLLEVGTGFHPELTGRENIYLNGAILGMKRTEIDLRFDEIVQFSEAERFLDTPVKHFSSGMYLRLAFSVAAHLEHEILLVDEVLAVGDASFRQKCISKMGSIAREGRTVVFVSHNMGAIAELCSKAILLQSGKIRNMGDPNSVISNYLNEGSGSSRIEFPYIGPRDGKSSQRYRVAFVETRSSDGLGHASFAHGDPIVVRVGVAAPSGSEITLGIGIRDVLGSQILHFNSRDAEIRLVTGSELHAFELEFENTLNGGNYFITVWVGDQLLTSHDYVRDCLRFTSDVTNLGDTLARGMVIQPSRWRSRN